MHAIVTSRPPASRRGWRDGYERLALRVDDSRPAEPLPKPRRVGRLNREEVVELRLDLRVSVREAGRLRLRLQLLRRLVRAELALVKSPNLVRFVDRLLAGVSAIESERLFPRRVFDEQPRVVERVALNAPVGAVGSLRCDERVGIELLRRDRRARGLGRRCGLRLAARVELVDQVIGEVGQAGEIRLYASAVTVTARPQPGRSGRAPQFGR